MRSHCLFTRMGVHALVLAGLCLCLARGASAQESPATAASDIDARLRAVEEVVRRQAEIIAEQQRQIQELAAPRAVAALETGTSEPQKEELPGWLKGLKFSGDFRLRYEGAFYDGDESDCNRGRFRLRFGVEKQISEGLVAGLRLASGHNDDPTGTNQTMTGSFSKKNVWIDLAYAVYAPPAVPGLTIGAGKFKNPFVHTDMMWDSDVNPEGVFEHYVVDAAETFKPFVAAGQLFLRSNADGPDANLLAWQGGFNWNIRERLLWTFAVTYYDYYNVEQPGNFYAARGNTTAGGALTAGGFNVLNLTNFLAFNVKTVPVRLVADYARNLDEDAPAPEDGLDTAYALAVIVGRNREKGDWQLDYKYAEIEANAVLGAFVDGDFPANRRGHVLGATYMLHKNVAARIAAIITRPEAGPGPERTLVHADLVFRF